MADSGQHGPTDNRALSVRCQLDILTSWKSCHFSDNSCTKLEKVHTEISYDLLHDMIASLFVTELIPSQTYPKPKLLQIFSLPQILCTHFNMCVIQKRDLYQIPISFQSYMEHNSKIIPTLSLKGLWCKAWLYFILLSSLTIHVGTHVGVLANRSFCCLADVTWICVQCSCL